MSIRYIIPFIPPSNNMFKGRENHWQYRELKKEWSEIVSAYCRPKPTTPLTGTVTFTYFFNSRRRHDPDNYNGVFILDGLVRAGVLKDDSFECITLKLRGAYDKSNPRTEIEIEEMGMNK